MKNMLGAVARQISNGNSEESIQTTWKEALKIAGLSDEQIKDTMSLLSDNFMIAKRRDGKRIEVIARSLVNRIINAQLKSLIEKSKNFNFTQTILCVGETEAQRKAGLTEEVVKQDLKEILRGITADEAERIGLRIAYEPRWAIGTGLVPTLDEIQDAHAFIKKTSKQSLGIELDVDYGGSLNPKNAKDILALKDVDGGLIGGAAKNPETIAVIIDEAINQGAQKGKVLNIGLNWKAETEDTGLASLVKFVELFKKYAAADVQIVISTPTVAVVKQAFRAAEAPESEITGARVTQGKSALAIPRVASEYGPHPSQGGLRPLYERVAGARPAPEDLRIKDIFVFMDQKHGAKPKEAISFGMVLENDAVIIHDAPVMGGISSGSAEPETHQNIAAAIKFFEENVRSKLIGLNIGTPDAIDRKIVEIDQEFRAMAENKDKPLFSYIGGELSVGISMMATIALAEMLHVPPEVVINYRYNEYCLKSGLAKEVRPISIPVIFGVVFEGGMHGVAKTSQELVKEGIITDISRFPDGFAGRLAMVPPQEVQIMVLAPEWQQAHDIGIKLTKIYQGLLENKYGIKIKGGAESGATTDQMYDKNGRLITLELVLDILNEAVDELLPEEAKYVRYALDIAASEMYIPEIDMYYIGPESAGNKDGLVTNEQFTEYKLKLFKKYWRFISCEDWADEKMIEHWEPQKLIMDEVMRMIGMGDDFVVSRPDLVEKYTKMGLMNAHLQKPNQSGLEDVSIAAIAISHSLNNVVVASHRGTRSAQEKYTAWLAMAAGVFGGKWTLWGVGRGALIAALNQFEKLTRAGGAFEKVKIPYQGGLVLDPDGPYKDYPFAQRIREEIAAASSSLSIKDQQKVLQQISKKTPSKIFYLVIDGVGGVPVNGRTELEAAKTPNLDELVWKSDTGLVDIMGVRGLIPGSGPGHFALFGYDPFQAPGRGILDALGAEIPLEPGDIVARGNFATLTDGVITDRRAGRIKDDPAKEIVKEYLSDIEIDGVKFNFYATKEHRVALVIRGNGLSLPINDSDPGKENLAPLLFNGKSEQEKRLADLMNKLTKEVNRRLADNYVNIAANAVIFRGFDTLQ
ncbi:MAG: triose-phosphate isomerase, partial [Candidatus Omnitrophota bacterium]